MASRSAGTLITDYNATYIPPALMPGYRGYVPTINFTYGDTYGNATRKYFQDFRLSALSTSQSPYSNGGQFPTIYSNDPSLVRADRAHNRNRWLYAPQWSRYDVHFDRNEELKTFDKLAQQHRESYKDTTGTIPRVDHFVLPGKEEYTFPYLPNMLVYSLVHAVCSYCFQRERPELVRLEYIVHAQTVNHGYTLIHILRTGYFSSFCLPSLQHNMTPEGCKYQAPLFSEEKSNSMVYNIYRYDKWFPSEMELV